MHPKRFVKTMCLLALTAFVLSWGIEQVWAAPGKIKSRDANAIREKIQNRVTPEKRKKAAQGGGISATAVVPAQGGTPNYFGPESNWAFTPTIPKFVDSLPGLYISGVNSVAAADNNLGQYIPVAVADTTTFAGSDYYVIELGQYTKKLHSNLNPTTLRGYRQVNTSDPAVSQFNYLGPVILAQKDRPVRIKFINSLPTGAGGDLFIPVDTTVMGAGMGPNQPMAMMAEPTMDPNDDPKLVRINTMTPHNLVVQTPVILDGFTPAAYNGRFRVVSVIDAMNFTVTLKSVPGGPATTLGMLAEAYSDARGTLHLHGGLVPWISDGTEHQWTTPAGEFTNYDRGDSTKNVPDMPDPGDGAITFFYPNQQSARLMFYHDHAFGITRLNVYAGEAAGYVVEDPVEAQLQASGVLPPRLEQIPLVIQDKTFLDTQLVVDPKDGVTKPAVLVNDPTWPFPINPARSDLWVPHVYMPNQNPNLLDGVNPLGRWDYGPWIWPPFPSDHPPIELADGALGFGTDGAPDLLPNLPDISMGMEHFNDTPLVNGTVYPYLEVQPKAYRFRILNAANDRFWNLQLHKADPAAPTEVKMVPFGATQQGGAAWPAGWPTPDLRNGGIPDPAMLGPKFIQIGTEGGFLPTPVVLDNIPIGWDRDPKSMTVGNVLEHNLFLGCAERADVIVDFSQFAGQTLILYNDAPAAVPARDPRFDYYTGNTDETATGGHAPTLAGFGPNIRTIMQIRVAPAPIGTTPVPYDIAALNVAFATSGPSQGVFVKSQDPIIVPQDGYNSAYGATFPSGATAYERIQSTSLTFNPLDSSTPAPADLLAASATILNKPKAIIEEFKTDWGRMASWLGIEVPFTNALNQTSLWLYLQDPPTEYIDQTTTGVQIGQAGDGTQFWKITHNGVDTHPIHFHLFNVQLINRVDWANVVKPPEQNELGWKETIRMNPLEDCIVALRPITPKQPFGQPDSIRLLDPTMPAGAANVPGLNTPFPFTQFDPNNGGADYIPPITNQLWNFHWEYVWHCHILNHEEMEMMRPIVFNYKGSVPDAPALTVLGGSTATLTWTDGTPPTPAYPAAGNTWANPASEIGFRIERSVNGGAFAVLSTTLANAVSYIDSPINPASTYQYRVVAFSAEGESVSNTVTLAPAVVTPPAAPSGLTLTNSAAGRAPLYVDVRWVDNSANEDGFAIERNTGLAGYVEVARVGAGVLTWRDSTVAANTRYYYRVRAYNAAGYSAYTPSANILTRTNTAPPAPTSVVIVSTQRTSLAVGWNGSGINNETGFQAQSSTSAAGPWTTIGTTGVNGTSLRENGLLPATTHYYQVRSVNDWGTSAWVPATPVSGTTLP